MSEIIFGVFVPQTSITKKVVEEAVFETKPRYCSDTGKKLADQKILVKPELSEFKFLGEVYSGRHKNGTQIYQLPNDVIAAFCYTKHNKKGLRYTSYGMTIDKVYIPGFLIGFGLDNYSDYDFAQLETMKKSLKNDFGLKGNCILKIEVDRESY